jgi:hypothetical protein
MRSGGQLPEYPNHIGSFSFSHSTADLHFQRLTAHTSSCRRRRDERIRGGGEKSSDLNNRRHTDYRKNLNKNSITQGVQIPPPNCKM